MPSAEVAYLFRHALLRDAAYQLQTPAQRGRMHALALELIETLFGGRPAHVRIGDAPEKHASDPILPELVHHARNAAAHDVAYAEAWRQYLYRAARHARVQHSTAESVAFFGELAPLVEGVERATILHFLGIGLRGLGRLEPAERALLEAEQCFAQSGIRDRYRELLISLGALRSQQLRTDEAMDCQRRAIELARETGDGRAESKALNSLAIQLRRAGELAEADAVLARALEIAREIGDAEQEGTALANVALWQGDRGEIAEAERSFHKALELLRQAEDLPTEGYVLMNLAILYSEHGRKQEGEREFRRALAIARRVGDRSGEASAAGNLAIVLRQRGERAEAEQLLLQSIELAVETGSSRTLGLAYGEYAALLRETGQPARALVAAQRAVELHRATRFPLGEASDGCEVALCRLACGEIEQAAQTWARYMPELRRVGLPSQVDEKLQAMRQTCARAGVQPYE